MKKVITVSREFGSGGRTIAKALAERMGYAYYDKELIEKAAEESGLSQEYIEKYGEAAPGKSVFSYAFIGRDNRGASVGDYLWNVQRKVIEDIAEKGNCVIVGRCADYILKEMNACLHVFIHASEEFRKERIVRLYGESGETPAKRQAEKDRARAMNYKYYTDQTWGMAKNYHMILCSSELGIEKCVEMVVNATSELG